MAFYTELGKKIGDGYAFAKKGLNKVVSIGQKISHFVKSAPVQEIYSLLPPSIQTPLAIAGRIGERALTGLETLQSRLNTGEAMANRVKQSFEASKNIQLARQPKLPPPSIGVNPVDDYRIPNRLITGGNQNQTINTRIGMNTQMRKGQDMMMF